MIYAYTGTPGSGKSYTLVKEGIRALAKGQQVWANFSFHPELVYVALRNRYRLEHRKAVLAADSVRELRSFEDLVGLYDCTLLFDEAHDWLNSRSWNVIPREIISWWSQHRHAGVDVHLATQRLGSVDSHVRALVGHVYLCRPAAAFVQFPVRLLHLGAARLVLRLTEVQDEAGLAGKGKSILEGAVRNRYTVLDPVIARCYNTRGGVFPSPLHALERKESELGLSLDFAFKQFRESLRPGPVDGLPALTWTEYADALRRGQEPHALLEEKFTHSSGMEETAVVTA